MRNTRVALDAKRSIWNAAPATFDAGCGARRAQVARSWYLIETKMFCEWAERA